MNQAYQLGMSGRAPKRIRRGSAISKAFRGGSHGKWRRGRLSQSEEGELAHYTMPNIDPKSEPPRASRQPIGLAPPGKMPLPPLPRSRADQSSSSKAEKVRTLHACDKCRKAKAKCSGGQPCYKCRNEGDECVYGDGKRDKEKKEMERLQYKYRKVEQRNDQLVNALLNFAPELSPKKRKELEVLIMSPGFETDDDEDMLTNPHPETRGMESKDVLVQGEEDVHAEVGSAESIDVINEDTNRDEHTRAAGFMGKSSAVTWVQRAKKAATHDLQDEYRIRRSSGPDANGSFTDSTYHAESGDIHTVNPDEVNALEWSPYTVAKGLVDAYFNQVHESFPILSKNDFYKKFDMFPKDKISTEDQCWLSVANMVFAIGARFAHLTNADFRGDDRDHQIYYARARALGMDQRTLNQDPELQHTSCLGVLGLYLLATDQLNRSWTVCSIAVRNAMSLGLHIRSEARNLSAMDKELRVRLWWSLYSLEGFLDELTGRPSCISDQHISTPLPVNIDEAQFRRDVALYDSHIRGRSAPSPVPKGKARLFVRQIHNSISSSSIHIDSSLVSSFSGNSLLYSAYTFPMTRLPVTSSTYFIYRTQLSIISHEILTQLYCATLVKAKWSEVQDTIRKIDSRLLSWKASLPEELDFSSPTTQHGQFAPQRTGLFMFYNSSRMMLFRPCLCRFEGRIENESERSKAFDSNSAVACVQSARNVLASLPSILEPAKLYSIVAWWMIVHYIVEAGSVLMLELAYKAEHLPSQAEEILDDSKKVVLWLRAISDQSIAARKGWEIFDSLLKTVAPKVGGDTWSMPKSAPVPPGWRWNRFGTCSKRQFEVQISNGMLQTEGKPFPTDTSRTNEWVDQSNYDIQQGYSTPVPTPTSGCFTAGGVVPNFLIGVYRFNEIYGRHDEYGQLRNMYYPTATSPRAQGLLAPQLVSIGQVQLGGEIGDYGGANSYDMGNTGTLNYEIGGYRGWDEAAGGDVGSGGSGHYGEEHAQG